MTKSAKEYKDYADGYAEGEKQGRQSMLLEVQQIISNRISNWRTEWQGIVNPELGEAMKIDELIDELHKEGKDE